MVSRRRGAASGYFCLASKLYTELNTGIRVPVHVAVLGTAGRALHYGELYVESDSAYSGAFPRALRVLMKLEEPFALFCA